MDAALGVPLWSVGVVGLESFAEREVVALSVSSGF